MTKEGKGDFGMINIFYKLVDMSISASWLVFAIVLLRLVFRKAPKKIMCCLWALAAIRLVCPFAIESSFSLVPSVQTVGNAGMHDLVSIEPDMAGFWDTSADMKNALPGSENDTQGIMDGASSLISPVTNIEEKNTVEKTTGELKENSSIKSVVDGVQGADYDMPRTAAGIKHITAEKLAKIWIVGIGVMLLYAAVSYMLLYTKTRASLKLEGNVYICDDIDTPFILGVFAPKIYLPSMLTAEERECVMAHEKAHLKRFDNLWKPLGYIIFSVYWFNPVMWAAYILLCRDIELACDEKVISDKTMDFKKQYAMALLNCSSHRKIVSACPLAFGEVSVKTRIRTVLNYKKPTFWIIIAAVAACVVVTVCFMTNPIGSCENEGSQTESVIAEGATESDSETVSEEIQFVNEESFEYGGWRVTISEQQGYKYFYIDNNVLIRNIDTRELTELKIFYPSVENPYLEMKESDEYPRWGVLGTAASRASFTDGDVAVGVYKYEQSLQPLSTNEAEKGYFVMYASPDKKDIWYLDIPLGMKKDEVERIMAGINIEVLPQNEVRHYQADSELSCAEQLKLAADRIAFLTFFADDSDPQGYIYEYGKRGFDVYAEEMKLTRPYIYEKLKEPVSSLCTILDAEPKDTRIIEAGYGDVIVVLNLGSIDPVIVKMRMEGELWKPIDRLTVDSYDYKIYSKTAEYESELTNDKLTELIIDESPQSYIWEDDAEGFIVLDSTDNGETVLYGSADGHWLVLQKGERVIPITISWRSHRRYIPQIVEADYDNDGKTEYALWVGKDSGTGISTDGFYMLETDWESDAEGKVIHSLTEYRYHDSFSELNALDFEYDEADKCVTVLYNGNTVGVIDLTGFFEQYGGEYKGIDFGNIYSFTYRDGDWYFSASGGTYADSVYGPVYNYGVEFAGRVVYDGNYFHLEDIKVLIEDGSNAL